MVFSSFAIVSGWLALGDVRQFLNDDGSLKVPKYLAMT
jgi:hypothetical protein